MSPKTASRGTRYMAALEKRESDKRYDIDDPSGGPASVGADGELEALLVFTR